ncbi:MAG TPA: ATP-binding protein [Pirellulaceae bacterium]|jgi:AAA+ superfamily predicted ATPase|nr:ATP-binding protein [Pirellulaceae bacterium]
MQFIYEVAVGVALILTIFGVPALCIYAGYLIWKRKQPRTIGEELRSHFAGVPLERIAVSKRSFPGHVHADLFRAVETALEESRTHVFSGLEAAANSYTGGTDFNSLFQSGGLVGTQKMEAPQYTEIDVGEDKPLRVLSSGLWALSKGPVRFVVLFRTCETRRGTGACVVEVAAPDDEAGTSLVQEFFARLESEVVRAASYRGKILSFERESSYAGTASGMKVHRLKNVARDEVILPKATLDLLERNVIRFVAQRQELGRRALSRKKGLLFYGPPGTGKTHTIRWLVGTLEGHTALLIAAQQMGALGEYLKVARLLQPSVVVIEDVDLIALDRSLDDGRSTQALLHELLNEMDGLRDDCDVTFILTTNRPQDLEQALASRPGRIDQAIEFPLPDAEGREKLVRLYGRGCELSDELVRAVVERTEKVSASFIKELMRRAVQFRLERNGAEDLLLQDVDRALDEMLFSGGSLNLKLLGASGRIDAGE